MTKLDCVHLEISKDHGSYITYCKLNAEMCFMYEIYSCRKCKKIMSYDEMCRRIGVR